MLKKILSLFVVVLILGYTTQTQAQSITVSILGSTTGLPLTASKIAQTNVLCKSASTGSVTVAGAGGSGTYSYTINTASSNVTGVSSGIFTGLTVGTYTVTVTSGLCTATQAVTITEPSTTVSAAVSGTLQIACGLTTASATVTASGGTSPYTYAWPTNTTFTPANTTGSPSVATGLSASTYNVTVTDANNCPTSPAATAVVITAPNATLSATVTPTQILCNSASPGTNGSTTGSIAVTAVTPNTAVPAYAWSSPVSTVTAAASSLAAGSYTVTVSASGYCPFTSTQTINTAPAAVSATFVKADDGCETNLGTVTLTGTGGTSPFTMAWISATENPVTTPRHPAATGSPAINIYTSASTTGAFSNLTGGYDYKFVIKDGNGCTTN